MLFPEIGLVEIFLSNVYQNINIFNLKKKNKNKSTAKNNKQTGRQKAKETKKEKRISVENEI